MEHISFNLAVKLPDKGEVKISVIEVKRSKDQTTIQFSVSDTGNGISEEQQARLFQALSQADISTTRQYGGTGLGLAIAKRLVEMVGGKIWIKSDPGKGSTFSFTVAFGLSDTMPLNPTITHKELHGMRVLVVDDNAQAREIFTAMPDSMNFKADAVESAAEAMDVIAATDQYNPYGIVITAKRRRGLRPAGAPKRPGPGKPFARDTGPGFQSRPWPPGRESGALPQAAYEFRQKSRRGSKQC